MVNSKRFLFPMMIASLLAAICLLAASPASAQQWPRLFTNYDGSVTQIPAQPKRVLSTSATVTGTLLAIDAPLIASASDNSGAFFGQWKELALQRSVTKLWPAGSVDLESVYLEQPDLIVVSSTGADSALDQLQELQSIAPTILVDYSRQSWQDLALQLASALGLEDHAESTIRNFDNYVSVVGAKLNLPDGKVNIISYQGPGVTNAVATPESAHAQLLSSLGFTIEAPDPKWQASPITSNDFVRINYENLTNLRAETTFLLAASEKRTNEFYADDVLKNLPSIKKNQVYSLGVHSFRIDLFSAKEIVENIAKRFK